MAENQMGLPEPPITCKIRQKSRPDQLQPTTFMHHPRY